jgi:hypothetical protein
LNCPECGMKDAYQGMMVIECCAPACRHYNKEHAQKVAEAWEKARPDPLPWRVDGQTRLEWFYSWPLSGPPMHATLLFDPWSGYTQGQQEAVADYFLARGEIGKSEHARALGRFGVVPRVRAKATARELGRKVAPLPSGPVEQPRCDLTGPEARKVAAKLEESPGYVVHTQATTRDRDLPFWARPRSPGPLHSLQTATGLPPRGPQGSPGSGTSPATTGASWLAVRDILNDGPTPHAEPLHHPVLHGQYDQCRHTPPGARCLACLSGSTPIVRHRRGTQSVWGFGAIASIDPPQ